MHSITCMATLFNNHATAIIGMVLNNVANAWYGACQHLSLQHIIMLEFFSVQTSSFKVFHCLTSDMQATYIAIPTTHILKFLSLPLANQYRDIDLVKVSYICSYFNLFVVETKRRRKN